MTDAKVLKSSIDTGVEVLKAKIERDTAKIEGLEKDIEFYTGKIGELCEARLLVAERDLFLRKAITKQLSQVITILENAKFE